MKNIFIISLLFFASNVVAQKKYDVGQIKTPYGEILIWLCKETPNHKASFIQLAKAGYLKKRKPVTVLPHV